MRSRVPGLGLGSPISEPSKVQVATTKELENASKDTSETNENSFDVLLRAA